MCEVDLAFRAAETAKLKRDRTLRAAGLTGRGMDPSRIYSFFHPCSSEFICGLTENNDGVIASPFGDPARSSFAGWSF